MSYEARFDRSTRRLAIYNGETRDRVASIPVPPGVGVADAARAAGWRACGPTPSRSCLTCAALGRTPWEFTPDNKMMTAHVVRILAPVMPVTPAASMPILVTRAELVRAVCDVAMLLRDLADDGVMHNDANELFAYVHDLLVRRGHLPAATSTAVPL